MQGTTLITALDKKRVEQKGVITPILYSFQTIFLPKIHYSFNIVLNIQIEALKMSILNLITITGMVLAVVPSVVFYVFLVRGFEESAEQTIQHILVTQEETTCRIKDIIVRLRQRGKSILANRLEACAKRHISMMQFRTYLLTIEDQCRARHPRLWHQLDLTYGITTI